MKPAERKVWLSGGISIFTFSFSFSRKLAILFSPLWISVSLTCRACTLTRIDLCYGLPQSTLACIVVFFLSPFRLRLICWALALCLNGYFWQFWHKDFRPFSHIHGIHKLQRSERAFHCIFICFHIWCPWWGSSNHVLFDSYTDELPLCYELYLLMQIKRYSPSYMDPWPF